jgi:hypothetical protein
MVSVTIKVDYIAQGKQHSCSITASAKTYNEAYNKAMEASKDFKDKHMVTATSVSQIVYN